MANLVARSLHLGPEARKERHLCLVGGACLLATFAWDLATPTGIAGGVPFDLPVLLGFAIGTRRYAWATGAAGIGLTLVGWAASPAGAVPWSFVALNRVMAIVVIAATTAALLVHLRATEQAAAARASRDAAERARREAEAALREHRSQARLGEMTAAIAHEVKNPIAGIVGALQVIEGRLPATDPARPIARSMQERMHTLARTMDELMALAHPEPVAAAPIAAAELLRPLAAAAAADPRFGRVRIDATHDDDATIEVDARQVQAALLLVALGAAQAGASRVSVRGRRRADGYEIVVTDDGPGVPPEARAHLQALFDTNPRAGIGVAVAQRTAAAHGGRLELRTPASGAELAMVLPLARS